MTWDDLFWGVLLAIAVSVWMRGVTNHTRNWHVWEYTFSTLLVIIILIAASQLF